MYTCLPIVDLAGSREPPLANLNLGKSCVQSRHRELLHTLGSRFYLRDMAPPAMNSLPRTRQLSPTVGPAASGVTFRVGLLGGFGDTIAIGTATIDVDGGFGRIVYNGAYMPARNHLVSAYVIPVGSVNIFIGMTAEALGFRGEADFFRPPSTQSTKISTPDSELARRALTWRQ